MVGDLSVRIIFWTLWFVNAAAAAVVVYFFFAGAADGSVSSFNIGMWLGLLAACLVIVAGSLALRAKGHAILALLMLMPGAAGTTLYALFIILIVATGPRWN